jgi:hypothetical protein
VIKRTGSCGVAYLIVSSLTSREVILKNISVKLVTVASNVAILTDVVDLHLIAFIELTFGKRSMIFSFGLIITIAN